MNYYISRTNTMGVLQQSCGSLACLAAVLRIPEIAQKSQKKMNIAAALRCCSLHHEADEADARNPEICHHR